MTEVGDSSSDQYVYDAARLVTSHSMRPSGSIASGVVEVTVARWTPPLHRWHDAYQHPGLRCSAVFSNTQTCVPRSLSRLFHAPYRYTGGGCGCKHHTQGAVSGLAMNQPTVRGRHLLSVSKLTAVAGSNSASYQSKFDKCEDRENRQFCVYHDPDGNLMKVDPERVCTG